jgi:hypothetical protein
MKKLTSNKDIEMALELYQLNERVKVDKKRVNQLKDHFKTKVDAAAECAGLLITIDMSTRENVDKTTLRKILGGKAEQFISTTEIRSLKIRKAA